MEYSRRIFLACRRFQDETRAAAAVEFVMLLPLLILFIFATVEGGRLFHDYLVVDKSVRHATRYLSRLDVDCDSDPANPTFVDPLAITNAQNLAITGKIDNPATDFILGYWTDPTSITAALSCLDRSTTTFGGIYGAESYIPQVKLTASVPMTLIIGSSFLPQFSITIAIAHNEVVIGD